MKIKEKKLKNKPVSKSEFEKISSLLASDIEKIFELTCKNNSIMQSIEQDIYNKLNKLEEKSYQQGVFINKIIEKQDFISTDLSNQTELLLKRLSDLIKEYSILGEERNKLLFKNDNETRKNLAFLIDKTIRIEKLGMEISRDTQTMAEAVEKTLGNSEESKDIIMEISRDTQTMAEAVEKTLGNSEESKDIIMEISRDTQTMAEAVEKTLGNSEESKDIIMEISRDTQTMAEAVEKTLGNSKESIEFTNNAFEKINEMYFETERKAEARLTSLIDSVNLIPSKIKNFTNQIFEVTRATRIEVKELLWSRIFNDSICNTSWLKNKDLIPGRWAVGYPYLFVLFQALKVSKPKKILELGLGQTSKLISEYSEAFSDVKHIVVEHDDDWINFFLKENNLGKKLIIEKCQLENINYLDKGNVLAYKSFKEKFANEKFNLISIDGPFGDPEQKISRVDMCLCLPEILSDSFVILVDDYNRQGEKAMVAEIENILSTSHISFHSALFGGIKDVYVIVSNNWKFLTSI